MKEAKIVRLNKREIFGKKARISYLQILILIISSFAFCYLVAMTDSKVKTVEAAGLNCCPLTKTNATCLDFASSQCQDQCGVPCTLSQCSNDASCRLGCCYDPSQGTCSPNSPQGSCTSAGGTWKTGADCNTNLVPECRLGCCVLGNEVQFVSSKRCEVLSGQRSLRTDFRAGITNEAECIAISYNVSRGACVLRDNSCKMLTNNECRSLTGKNVVSALCTNPALNTSCKPTENTMCLEGKDEVYFQDSCGNAANIYDSTKSSNSSYWEQVVRKSDSCTSSPNSASCGNCDYFAGTKCQSYSLAGTSKPNKGNFVCADLSCNSAPYVVDASGKVLETKNRKNGESWCVYDGKIGYSSFSQEVVGSRHYRYSCVDGKVIVEPCADFRNEVCTEQSETDVGGINVIFSSAACRINTWQDCIGGDNCESEDCAKKSVTIDKFSKSLCVPKYSEGFDLSSEDAMKAADAICGQASGTCIVQYEKKPFGKCEPVVNERCLTSDFTNQMNELCISLGDCGGYVNVLGDYSDEGYTVTNAPKIATSFLEMATPIAGQKVPALSSLKVAERFGFKADVGTTTTSEDEGGDSGGIGSYFKGAGAVGLGVAGLGLATIGVGIIQGAAGYAFSGILTVNAFGLPLVAAGVGMIVGNIVGKIMGVNDPGIATVMAIAGGAMAAALVFAYFYQAPICVDATSCGISIGVAVIILIIIGLFGRGSCKPKIVEFTCSTWQPSSTNNCEKCTTNSELKPCSKYKCQSLGKACEFINEGTSNELCVTKKNDGLAPIIMPNYQAISSNFSYVNVSSGGFAVRQSDGRCIEAFSQLNMGISTNEPSQCKIDLEHKTSFDAMSNYFTNNLYLYNHTMAYSMPSIELILRCSGTNLTEADVMNQISNSRIYTRCKDLFGNVNSAEYLMDMCIRPGQDKTAPFIVSTNPENNANLAYNVTSKQVTIYTNEPADCKWSKSDKSYSDMENSFSRGDECEAGIYGWEHGTNLTGITLGENNFYIRCKDQPYLSGENESRRNENVQSYNYKLKVSQNPLTITSISPSGSVVFGSWPAPINLEIQTAGGFDNGKAWCYYKYGENWITLFSDAYKSFNELSSSHSQPGINLPQSGYYELPVKCSDGGNEVTSSAKFTIEVDQLSPQVVRVYNSGGSLYLYTNENSECSYSNSDSSCGFIFTNGTLMSGGFTQQHTSQWDAGKSYYIKCRDAWNNEQDGCSIRVKAYNGQASSF